MKNEGSTKEISTGEDFVEFLDSILLSTKQKIKEATLFSFLEGYAACILETKKEFEHIKRKATHALGEESLSLRILKTQEELLLSSLGNNLGALAEEVSLCIENRLPIVQDPLTGRLIEDE